MHKNGMKLYLSIVVIVEERRWQYILRKDGYDGTYWPSQIKKACGNDAFEETLEKSGINGNTRMTTPSVSLHFWQGTMTEGQRLQEQLNFGPGRLYQWEHWSSTIGRGKSFKGSKMKTSGLFKRTAYKDENNVFLKGPSN